MQVVRAIQAPDRKLKPSELANRGPGLCLSEGCLYTALTAWAAPSCHVRV
jgi:hypothetical protein